MYLKDLLTEEELEIKRLFRKFVDNEIMPKRLEIEQEKDLVAKILQDITDLGVLRMGYPKELGGEKSDKDFRKFTFDNIIESSVFLNNVLFVPILHESTPGKLIDLVNEFVQKFPKLCGSFAVAERDCGKSILERAETILQIRRIMNRSDPQSFLHILGCGNPKSMLLLTYCGADSFDSLDWLKHVINPADHSVHDFSHLELLNCRCHVCTSSAYMDADYLEKTLLHNLLYYRVFVDNLQSLIRNALLRPYLEKHIGNRIVKQIDKL